MGGGRWGSKRKEPMKKGDNASGREKMLKKKKPAQDVKKAGIPGMGTSSRLTKEYGRGRGKKGQKEAQ